MDPLPGAVPKAYRHGTHRAVAPEETFARARRLMPVMGITRVADVTGLDCLGIPVAMACRPNARSIAVSPGKGLDIVAAKTSALMEAAEGWHAERIVLPLLLASIHELYGRRLIDVARLPRMAVGELHPDLRILWIEGRDIVSGAATWVPFEVVHTNFSLPLPTCSGALMMGSNGLASGNHPLEAVSHALCELVERDAMALWYALSPRERRRCRVDLSTVDDPSCAQVLQCFERAGVETGVWDITSDVGIPAFRCAILDRDPSPLRSHLPGLGSGCHPSRAIALLRALTEAAQARLTLITGARDDMGIAHYVASQDRGAHEKIAAEMRAGRAGQTFRAVPDFQSETLDEDLAWELGRLRAVGIEQVVVVDLTKPGVGIPVVRVVIPGLEGVIDAPGYVPGERFRRASSKRGANERRGNERATSKRGARERAS